MSSVYQVRTHLFVENEVAMAFGLNKPLLFVIGDDEYARLPNTAKIGYPILDLATLRKQDWKTLVHFVSYLSADARSTLRLYGAVLRQAREHWGIFLLALIIAAFSLLAM